jgi:hypothetical protein
MTLIHQGQLYSALLVSNPPYGIDWSPVYAHGEQVGVQRGSIIAAINDKDIYELDHTLAATEPRDAFQRCDISLTLCIYLHRKPRVEIWKDNKMAWTHIIRTAIRGGASNDPK